MSQAAFALFVSCVEGAVVTRFGTRTYIGCERRALEPTVVDYHPEQIVAIPHDEFRKYRREYLRALRDGSLVTRTEDEWRTANADAPTAPTPLQRVGTPRASDPSAGEKPPHDNPDRSRAVR